MNGSKSTCLGSLDGFPQKIKKQLNKVKHLSHVCQDAFVDIQTEISIKTDIKIKRFYKIILQLFIFIINYLFDFFFICHVSFLQTPNGPEMKVEFLRFFSSLFSIII